VRPNRYIRASVAPGLVKHRDDIPGRDIVLNVLLAIENETESDQAAKRFLAILIGAAALEAKRLEHAAAMTFI